ncbi:hypothetical protein OEB96_04855 [Paraliomyxa miuraensis]|nr:hypothetical protein [Paraliomyxa miuraensis]
MTRIGTSMVGRAVVGVALLLGLIAGCQREDPPPRERVPSPPPPAASTPNDAAIDVAAADPARARLLAWLDPDAVSVAYLRTPLRADAVAVVYGLPPRAEDLLEAMGDVDEALEAIRPSDAPSATTWLGPQTLASASLMAKKPLVLRPLTVSRAEAITRLEALGLQRQEVDAFEVWVPRRVFPHRVVLLEGDVAGFIPVSDPGTGLPPLIAARDTPPSDVETQLDALLELPGGPVAAVFAAGPMLHLDFDQAVLAVRFELRPTPEGFDGQIALQIDGEPSAVVTVLSARNAPEQSDAVQQLMKRVTFVVDGPDRSVVAGRLQLSTADAAPLLAEP